MSCVVLQKAILHSHSETVLTGGFWCMVNMVCAVSEVTNGNAADAVRCSSVAEKLCIYGPGVVLTGEVLPSLHWCFKVLT